MLICTQSLSSLIQTEPSQIPFQHSKRRSIHEQHEPNWCRLNPSHPERAALVVTVLARSPSPRQPFAPIPAPAAGKRLPYHSRMSWVLASSARLQRLISAG
jgi:hypothetical protein